MKILILREHHGDRYLDISTDEKLLNVALSIIKGRFGKKNDYYPFEKPVPPVKPDFTREQYETLPESLKGSARKALDAYEHQLESYEEELESHNEIIRCIETNDRQLALRILKSRKNNEDESYLIKEVKEEY